jgi:serine/threonine protein kinase
MWSAKEEEPPPPQPDDEGQEIDEKYIIGSQVGRGGFSVVKEVFSLEGGQKVRRAVKIVRKQVPGKDEDENERLQTEFDHEVAIWRYLKHRHILPLLAVYESEFATFCITQFNVGGTLFDLVHSRRQNKLPGLPAHLARRYVYQLASAIQYLHEEVRVVHRDIKLENVLLDMSAPDSAENGGNVLLCDFGMADYIFNEGRTSPEPLNYTHDQQDEHGREHGNIGPSQTSTSVTGSLRYAAPELFSANGRQLYSPAADIWAFGNIVYALLTNRLAFDDPFEPRVVMSIMAADWDEEPIKRAEGADENALELVRGCLRKNDAGRWTIGDVVGCRWLEGCDELYGVESEDYGERLWANGG